MLDLCNIAAIKIAIDVGLFDCLSRQGEKSVGIEDLSRITKVEARLLHRILRVLANTNNVVETGPSQFQANESSRAWTESNIRATCDFHYDHTFKTLLTLPSYFRDTGYEEPRDPSKAPWNVCNNTSLPFFDWLDLPGNETARRNFDKSMSLDCVRRHWFDTIPASEILGSACDTGSVLIVDVGGGNGENAFRLHTAHPDLVGRLIVQDLPKTINEATKRGYPAKIELMEYDFFTAQPIQGAKNYYLRALHDWPDKEAIQILRNQRSAMRKGYSRIVLSEKVISEQGVSAEEAVTDLVLMIVAAKQRTEREWKQLVAQVGGLQVTGVIAFQGCSEKLIIIELE